ncbi:neuropathy target esterase sws isoform X3 [Drosophila simulans]|uniref:neuropathy target esterase sws isoform X3 n=1 Tax=Drosophila simulans TaxID=7240 RepID=UPI00078AF075|nr:neuropathy target esterase sws isoform X3 [Drosophila simulans]KMZ08688.1 sws, isoform D [Drosophila simulans]
MDVLEMLRASASGSYNTIFSDAWCQYVSKQITATVYMYCALVMMSLLFIAWFLYFKRMTRLRLRDELARSISTATNSSGDLRGLRFRKRDKMLFYGRRMLRKVKNVSGQMYSSGKGYKRRAVMRFARRILQLRRDNMPLEMRTVEPPAEYLEETIEGSDRVPPDALYMLQSIRIFGHFEKPVFLRLCKHTQLLELMAGDYLFKITDPDDSVYIVQSGMINVYISNADGSTLSLKTVRKGESVTSLLSFIDVLSGNPSYYKTVTAKAIEKSVVIRLPMQAFEEVFQDNPDVMIRVIQVIMIRLQRVLFTALRNYLGLNAELVQNHMRYKSVSTMSGPINSQTSQSSRQAPNGPPMVINQMNLMQSAASGTGSGVSVTVTRPPPSPSRHSREEHTLSDPNPNPDGSFHGTTNLFTEVHGDAPNADLFHQQQQPSVGNLSTRRSSITLMAPDGSHSCPQTPGVTTSIDMRLVQSSAVDSLRKELGLSEEDSHIIEPFVELRELEPNVTLITEGNADDVCVWFVMTGTLAVYQSNQDATRAKQDKSDMLIHFVHPGEIVGGLAMLTGEASAYTIRSRSNTRIAFIRRAAIYQIMRQRPRIVLDLGNGVVRRLSPLVRQCDYALDWIFLESGRAVYRQDESSDSTYIVLSGRMRSVITHPGGKKEIVGEYGKGDLVGIVEMITETSRTTTVMAVRDSELAKLPEGLFNAIKLRYPIVVTKLISFLSHRFLGSMQTRSGSGAPGAPVEANPVTHKYSTVALVPITDEVPLTPFTYELYHSLCAIGPVLRLTSDVVRKQLGSNIFEAANEYRLTSWLAQQEDRNIITLYQCDSSLSAWTQRCMRQADVILIVGLGDRSHLVGKFEREIDRLAMRTQKELVLLYPEATNAKPANTLSWLNARPWVTKHHHVLCVKRIFTRKSQYRINDLYSRVLLSEPNMHSDFSRLARWLTGNSIGLVLGGGGARGAAHIGMLKAIQEAGIPVDMVGGVSIGALMGALWCSDRNITTVTQKAREWSKKMTKWFLQLLDLTYPITSMFSGREFNKTIHDTFGDVSIEDLWIPYFTLTTDITASCHRIHTNGHLWRYCRASMSIAGVFPPFCDYRDGHLLLDGCYTNNVPADVMHNLGAAHIIAIDVGSQDDTDLTNYGDDLSGWWLLYKKWNPFTSPVKVPDLPDIQSRLAYVSCVRQLEEVKNSDYCEYIRPPIDKYKTLAFGSFDEIRDVGYVFGKNYFENMAKAGRLGRFNQWFNKEPPKRVNHASLNEYTFIDLAQIVCRLPETYAVNTAELFSEDEDCDGYISEPTTLNTDRRRIQVSRAGNSLSFSETEMDSDVELDLKLERKMDKSTQSSPPTSSRTDMRGKEEAKHMANWHWGVKHKDETGSGATVATHTQTGQEQELQQQQQQQQKLQQDQGARAEQLVDMDKEEDKENRSSPNNETKN